MIVWSQESDWERGVGKAVGTPPWGDRKFAGSSSVCHALILYLLVVWVHQTRSSFSFLSLSSTCFQTSSASSWGAEKRRDMGELPPSNDLGWFAHCKSEHIRWLHLPSANQTMDLTETGRGVKLAGVLSHLIREDENCHAEVFFHQCLFALPNIHYCPSLLLEIVYAHKFYHWNSTSIAKLM